jgi:hypothetical protein
MAEKIKVLYFVERYAQISETYIENEIRALGDDYKVRILSLVNPDLPMTENRLPYTLVRRPEHTQQMTEDFKPDVVHGHYLTMLDRVFSVAKMLDVPFTLRAHSFDILAVRHDFMASWASLANSDYCQGILTFPFTIPLLVKLGFDESKLIPCNPVVDIAAFEDHGPNGTAVMNTGAALPKKQMEDFILLGSKVPQREFHLYPLGYDTARLAAYNMSQGKPIKIMRPVQPSAMPKEYKKHEWLVYTASPKTKSIGWPMAVAEAQASGVGVCMAGVRPDLKDYVGDCGFIYDSLDEAARIISQPFPQEMRERGFEWARRCDVRRHIHLLTDLWPTPAAAPAAGATTDGAAS